MGLGTRLCNVDCVAYCSACSGWRSRKCSIGTMGCRERVNEADGNGKEQLLFYEAIFFHRENKKG